MTYSPRTTVGAMRIFRAHVGRLGLEVARVMRLDQSNKLTCPNCRYRFRDFGGRP